MTRFQAVLFDVGGPLDTEVKYEQLVDEHIRAALAAEGIAVSDAAYRAANRWAIASFAPNAYQAIVWRLARGDAAQAERAYGRVAARNDERQAARGGLEPRPGMAALLEDLAGRGLLLGLAANQPASAERRLAEHGLARWFHHGQVSASLGVHKPDPRLLLAACTALGVAPDACLMVGDRIDNDIAPARLLGMTALRLRTGRHRRQRPRSWLETPDADVTTVPALRHALLRLLDN